MKFFNSTQVSILLVCSLVLLLGVTAAADSPGNAGLWSPREEEVIFESQFGGSGKSGIPSGYELKTDATRGGKQVLFGEVQESSKFQRFEIPFSHLGGKRITLTFHARSPDGARCAIWLRQEGEQRRSLEQIDRLPKAWTPYTISAAIPSDTAGAIEIVAPSSYNAPPGQAYLDDIRVTASVAPELALDHPEDFPVLCADARRGSWLAVTARKNHTPRLRVSRVLDSERELLLDYQPDGITGMGMPAIAAWSKGCIVAVPIEREGRWQIACLFIGRDHNRPEAIHYLDAGGSVNIDPAIDVCNDSALIVWEGNRDWPRGVYASRVHPEFASPVQAISASQFPSSNPDIVFIDDNQAFAAWDAYDGRSVNLFGAYYRDGRWQDVQQLTSDVRIERHVDLASRGGRVWLAWQAQSFVKHAINRFDEQRIALAYLADGGLHSLPGFFEAVSKPRQLLVRPQVAFTPGGSLVLSARQSVGPHAGWRAMAWSYDGARLSKPIVLWHAQGRWRPIAMATHNDQLIAACQRDNLPTNWGIDVGDVPDWHSDVVLVRVSVDNESKNIDATANTVAFEMPETEFDLTTHSESFSALLPRVTEKHEGKKLQLFWGDMHEHSDLSVCQRSTNPPIDDLWANQRDIEALDFTAITDHGYNLDHPQWYYSAERVRAHFDAGRFVSLLAEEWTSDHVHYNPRRSVRRYGHHNLVFQDPFYARWFDSRDDPTPTPRDVWKQIGDAEFISIPHQLADTGNSPTDWTYHDEHHQPLAEIFQQRDSYEYFGAPRQSKTATPFKGHFLQDAWQLGLIIGVIASPDHGGGKGKAGVWAEELTSESLFQAFHARHTFGTSGAKMSLFVSSGSAMMGDKTLKPESSIPFQVRASADRPITRVVILRNNKEVFVSEPGSSTASISWEDTEAPTGKILWYYVRIHRDDEELAWSSPIWFFPDRDTLKATTDYARSLPHTHAHGPPADDPGPNVNWRTEFKKRYK
jgi:hypothetical protein